MVIPKGKPGKEKNSRGRLFHIFLPIHLLLIREKPTPLIVGGVANRTYFSSMR